MSDSTTLKYTYNLFQVINLLSTYPPNISISIKIEDITYVGLVYIILADICKTMNIKSNSLKNIEITYPLN